MSKTPKVVKIKPTWEHVKTDKEGRMFFELTDIPKEDMERKKRASKKIMTEMENRQKI